MRPVFGRKQLAGLGMMLVAGGALAIWAIAGLDRPDPDALWRRAQLELRSGRIDRAAEATTRLARLRTPTPSDWMLLGQVALAQNRPDEALEDLQRVPDGHGLAPRARLMAGQIDLRRHRVRPAEKALRRALELDPKLIQARKELIYVYGVQLRRKELSEQFRALAGLTPLTFDNVFHWCLTRNTLWEPLEISLIMTRFLQADDGDRWSRLSLAESQRQLGKLEDAERTLAVLPPADVEARVIRIRLALDRGDDRAAETLLKDGTAEHAELARLRGRFALTRRDGPSALRHFREAYRLEPDNRDTLFGLSNALSMVGNQAESDRFRAISRDHDRLGTLLQRAATPGKRDDPRLLRELGAACETIHRLPEARAWYNLAISQNPLDAEAQQAISRLNAELSAASVSTPGT